MDVPGPHADKRFVQLAGEDAYEDLLSCGVRIWHFQASMLHAKTLTVDGKLSVVGSPNFNSRSMELDEEIAVVVLDQDFAQLLDSEFERDVTRSEEIDSTVWEDRSTGARLLEKVTKPFQHRV